MKISKIKRVQDELSIGTYSSKYLNILTAAVPVMSNSGKIEMSSPREWLLPFHDSRV